LSRGNFEDQRGSVVDPPSWVSHFEKLNQVKDEFKERLKNLEIQLDMLEKPSKLVVCTKWVATITFGGIFLFCLVASKLSFIGLAAKLNKTGNCLEILLTRD
jgi:hypothetical protein